MAKLFVLIVLMAKCVAADELPIQSGEYIFEHRFAEQPLIKSVGFHVTITGDNIVVVNNEKSELWPMGIVEEGALRYHSLSRQWIIIPNGDNKNYIDVGGCSAGPTVIDLINRIYWSC